MNGGVREVPSIIAGYLRIVFIMYLLINESCPQFFGLGMKALTGRSVSCGPKVSGFPKLHGLKIGLCGSQLAILFCLGEGENGPEDVQVFQGDDTPVANVGSACERGMASSELSVELLLS